MGSQKVKKLLNITLMESGTDGINTQLFLTLMLGHRTSSF